MIAAKATAPDELRMSGKEFDRIMSQALRVKPAGTKASKRSVKTKKARKKKIARK